MVMDIVVIYTKRSVTGEVVVFTESLAAVLWMLQASLVPTDMSNWFDTARLWKMLFVVGRGEIRISCVEFSPFKPQSGGAALVGII
jgi:hypothetical protein